MSDGPNHPDPTAERARIERPPPSRRFDVLPALYLVGIAILALALSYLYQHPALPPETAQQAAKVDALRQEIDARRADAQTLSSRLAALESRPAPPTVDLKPLESRLAALESRPVPAPPDLAPLRARLDALEQRLADLAPLRARLDALEQRQPADLGPLRARLDALEQQPALKPLQDRVATLEQQKPADLAPLNERVRDLAREQSDAMGRLSTRLDQVAQRVDSFPSRLDQIATRLDGLSGEAKQAAAGLDAIQQRAGLIAKAQAARAALDAGQPLGDIPAAPPALSRFAHDTPPTEAGLRLSFDAAADAARRAADPAFTGDQQLLGRAWARAQQSATAQQGDQAAAGNPVAGVLAAAREKLDASDLPGALKALDSLPDPAKAAMADWIARAQSLVDARRAIAAMAAKG